MQPVKGIKGDQNVSRSGTNDGEGESVAGKTTTRTVEKKEEVKPVITKDHPEYDKFFCSHCGSPMAKPQQASCGHLYHKRCVDELMNKKCSNEDCDEDQIIDYNNDKRRAKEYEKYDWSGYEVPDSEKPDQDKSVQTTEASEQVVMKASVDDENEQQLQEYLVREAEKELFKVKLAEMVLSPDQQAGCQIESITQDSLNKIHQSLNTEVIESLHDSLLLEQRIGLAENDPKFFSSVIRSGGMASIWSRTCDRGSLPGKEFQASVDDDIPRIKSYLAGATGQLAPGSSLLIGFDSPTALYPVCLTRLPENATPSGRLCLVACIDNFDGKNVALFYPQSSDREDEGKLIDLLVWFALYHGSDGVLIAKLKKGEVGSEFVSPRGFKSGKACSELFPLCNFTEPQFLVNGQVAYGRMLGMKPMVSLPEHCFRILHLTKKRDKCISKYSFNFSNEVNSMLVRGIDKSKVSRFLLECYRKTLEGEIHHLEGSNDSFAMISFRFSEDDDKQHYALTYNNGVYSLINVDAQYQLSFSTQDKRMILKYLVFALRGNSALDIEWENMRVAGD